jgi:hypothetical protein
MGKWKELAEPLDDTDAPTMKPTQEQVIAWARKAGGDDWGLLRDFMPEIERLVILAYEAGRKYENEVCAKEVDRWIGCDLLAAAIRARGQV